MENETVLPSAVRLETGTLCQLECPLCPTEREGRSVIGKGLLTLEHFCRFIDKNPRIRKIELAKAGEPFLNKELPKMLACAHAHGVVTSLSHGVNLNHATEEMLEALVKYQTEIVRVGIDGVSQGVYEKYRVGGSLKRVLQNIQTINGWKRHYSTDKPHLILQFLVFGHNQHELAGAAVLAKMLHMEFQPRLNKEPEMIPLKDADQLRELLGYTNFDEFSDKEGRHYLGRFCQDLWLQPQINWDGALLGCCSNKWVRLGQNVFNANLDEVFNSEVMHYTRAVVQGKAPVRQDIPCGHCEVYAYMQRSGHWVVPPGIAR